MRNSALSSNLAITEAQRVQLRALIDTVIPGARYMGVILAGSPDFVKLAEAYGVLGLRATRNDEVRPVLERLLEYPGPALADMQLVMEENCYPMVPVGKNLDEAIVRDPEPSKEG